MRRARVGIVVLLVSGSLVLTLLRFVSTASRWPAMLASFSTYAVVGYALALPILVVLLVRGTTSRRWTGAGLVVVVLGLGLHAWWLAPYVSGETGRTSDLTVMNANLQFGRADPATVLHAVHAHDVDVLVVEEMTPEELIRGFTPAGITKVFPYTAGTPDYSASGTMVFSRFPLTDPVPLPISHGGLAVTVAAPTPFRLLAVHPSQPVFAPREWLTDLHELRRAAASAVAAGPTVVMGDLNATPDHRPFRQVLAVGLRDAAEQANSGWQPTWPHSARLPIPRVIAIDHVMTSRQLAAVRTDTVELPGSDHRGLIAELDLR